MPHRVSKEEFAELVEKALQGLPEPFTGFLAEVPIEIRSHPTISQMKSVGLTDGAMLLGLYHGRPRTRRSVLDSGAMPDVIYIFQEHIEQYCNSRDELIEQVRKTVMHEIGHHFGMTEEDLTRIGYG